MKNYSLKQKIMHFFWNAWCIISVIGIWPRFIETRLLQISKINLKNKWPSFLNGIKILQFSDLHLSENSDDSFLEKIIDRVKKISPDLIVFSGDFLSYANLDNPKRLKAFLNRFSAPLGCYAILGNHDYQEYASINDKGDYDVSPHTKIPLSRGFRRLFSSPTITARTTERAQSTPPKKELVKLLEETPFKLLYNQTQLIPIKNGFLNICGLGEHMLGQCLPDKAFKNYDKEYPGIVLSHNPDSIPYLKNYPGDIILCGHTHGGQINLPLLCRKFMLVENPQFKRGLFKINHKWVYVNRGVGSSMKFRWFSIPEISLFELSL